MWSFSLKDAKAQNIRVFATIRQSEIEGALQSLKLTYDIHTLTLWTPGGDIYMLGRGTLHLSFGTIRKALYFSSLTRLWNPSMLSSRLLPFSMVQFRIYRVPLSRWTLFKLQWHGARMVPIPLFKSIQIRKNKLSPKSTHTIWLFVP